MIKYRLRCDAEHSFDAWFRDSAAYDKQAGAGLLTCPNCGSAAISKALMAPSVNSSKKKSNRQSAEETMPAVSQMPPEMAAIREKLVALRKEVESKFDYVGKEFAEEARKIHYGETDPHGIYGETSSDEAQALMEEGIEFTPIPWVPKSDA
ncbi:DUF1178 family protein [Nisaea acidiphila]|uniref:DUF1178 family protein n=1 Tax=Nisaea acidiphila TaxID=1862145 RepID=A0A9J7AXA1_9PROT|nr:DUF1178 family protein [Nisaea acidiphila]UUX51418.1 DUF1178 family protein [Nisaea acidiphila]